MHNINSAAGPGKVSRFAHDIAIAKLLRRKNGAIQVLQIV